MTSRFLPLSLPLVIAVLAAIVVSPAAAAYRIEPSPALTAALEEAVRRQVAEPAAAISHRWVLRDEIESGIIGCGLVTLADGSARPYRALVMREGTDGFIPLGAFVSRGDDAAFYRAAPDCDPAARHQPPR